MGSLQDNAGCQETSRSRGISISPRGRATSTWVLGASDSSTRLIGNSERESGEAAGDKGVGTESAGNGSGGRASRFGKRLLDGYQKKKSKNSIDAECFFVFL